MANLGPIAFFLRRKNEEISNAVRISHTLQVEKAYENIVGAAEALEEWAGRRCFRAGYKPIKAHLATNEADYRTQIGIGIFLEGERFEDMRGWLLDVMEAAEAVKIENERMERELQRHRPLVEAVRQHLEGARGEDEVAPSLPEAWGAFQLLDEDGN